MALVVVTMLAECRWNVGAGNREEMDGGVNGWRWKSSELDGDGEMAGRSVEEVVVFDENGEEVSGRGSF